ncbi:hypothetical protein ABPG77_005229 [Micractinium sp. CCAP 211/92]
MENGVNAGGRPAAGPPAAVLPEKVASFLPDAAVAAAAAAGAAKAKAQVKSFAVRKWLAVNPRCEVRHLELAKMRVTAGLGVQLRDLRLLDPQLATSYPSAILARERAIVVNLEFIKCIISMDNVYITSLEDQNTQQFVEELQRRLRAAAAAAAAGPTDLSSGPSGMFVSRSVANLSGAAQGGGVPLSSISAAHEELPFELRALEICLDTVSQYLERLTGDLEAAAHPALDALTGKINTSNLERVRRIKNRMVRLTTRVETLREVLEKFLDDDSDMKDLNLTAKEADRLGLAERRAGQDLSIDVPMPVGGMMPSIDSLPETPRPGQAGGSASSASSDSTDLEDDPDVAVVEMLMEPYFMQVDNTFNKLQTLCEYIDDTEDYIQIKLDSQRNVLIRLNLVLTSFSAAVALVTAITGLFAMNVMLRPNKEGQAPYSWFLAISISTGIGAIAIFAGVMAYCRWKRLI